MSRENFVPKTLSLGVPKQWIHPDIASRGDNRHYFRVSGPLQVAGLSRVAGPLKISQYFCFGLEKLGDCLPRVGEGQDGPSLRFKAQICIVRWWVRELNPWAHVEEL